MWKVKHGKFEESPPTTVDHVITDPPFDEASHKNGRRGTGKDGVSESVDKSFDPRAPATFAPELVDRCRRWCLCFCAVEQFGAYKAAVGEDRYFRSGIWRKTDPTPQFTGDRPGVFGEGIAIMHSRARNDDGTLVAAPRWNGGGKAAIWEYSTEAHFSGRDTRVHETQKPLDLMLHLIRDFTDEGDLVWDPFCGSGTTGVACVLSGRHFIGHEQQASYAEIAEKRIDAESKGNKLSDELAGQEVLF
jgi:site-specific DNA-methyltransferase (adenine-specific)